MSLKYKKLHFIFFFVMRMYLKIFNASSKSVTFIKCKFKRKNIFLNNKQCYYVVLLT